jgi:hypothetical protein
MRCRFCHLQNVTHLDAPMCNLVDCVEVWPTDDVSFSTFGVYLLPKLAESAKEYVSTSQQRRNLNELRISITCEL